MEGFYWKNNAKHAEEYFRKVRLSMNASSAEIPIIWPVGKKRADV